jgi:hypothetical protein
MIPSKEAPASKKLRQNTDNSAVQRLNFVQFSWSVEALGTLLAF